jgi:hypothetical protein
VGIVRWLKEMPMRAASLSNTRHAAFLCPIIWSRGGGNEISNMRCRVRV